MARIKLEHLIRLFVGAQIVVAMLLLTLGERSFVLLFVTVALLGLSTYVTDYQRHFVLSQPMADCLALLVVVVSAVIAYRSDRTALLVAVANLQSYLQFVLLFQHKSPRIYWQLALLSLGQVAIASTLVPGPAFGIMLLAYVMVGLVGFALLLVERETTRVTPTSPAPAGSETTSSTPLRLTGSVAAVEPMTLVRGMLLPAGAATLLTAILGLLMFFVLPRWNVDNQGIVSGEPLRTVGFSKTVTLGELGEVINNADLVMRIQFFRGQSNRPLKLEGEPLLRGTVVTEYENRTWRQSRALHPVVLGEKADGPIIRQRITVEPLDVRELFCVSPVFSLETADTRLRIDDSTQQLIRQDDFRGQPLDIELGTTGIVGNRQRDLIPSFARMRRDDLSKLTSLPEGLEGADLFPGLRALAAQVLEDKRVNAADSPLAAARILSGHFHQSNQYFYSLESQQRDTKLDPLEDFVTLHRSGHCEYFAGALVLMLRSQGIPARMVLGFKGGEWNPLGNYYQVQQLHAHAWVEVFLTPAQLPPEEFTNEEAPLGAWLMLDPTEGTQEGGNGQQGSRVWARARQSLDYARVLWINYVASLTPKRQRQGIYEPLAAGLDAAADNLTSSEVWQGRIATFSESRAARFWSWYRRHWFSWRGGLVAIGFSLLSVGLVVGLRRAAGKLWASSRWGAKQRAVEVPVLEMYRRLESALARQGLARLPAQTAYEFATAAGGELAERMQYRRVAHLPRRVVDSFCRVRFGGRTLDNQEAQAVEQALAELERVLSVPRGPGTH